MIPPPQRNAKPTTGVRRLRVVVAAADAAQRRAVRDALAGSPHIVVAADSRDEVETLELTRWYRPELVLVDLALPPRGAPVAKILAAATCAVVVLAPDRDDGPAGLGALRAGARGFVSLPQDADTLALSLRAVADGEVAISPRLVMALVVGLRALPDPHGLRPVRSVLTDREWEVLDLLGAGASTQEIADALLVTRDTVYGHVKRILRKLGARTREEAVTAGRALRTPIGA
jgi:NarL family two-component system response regulator LiaR